LGGEAGGGVVRVSAEEAGDFGDAFFGAEGVDEGFGGAVGGGMLTDVEMGTGLSGNGGEVGNEENLEFLGEAGEEGAHTLGGFAAEAGVYFI